MIRNNRKILYDDELKKIINITTGMNRVDNTDDVLTVESYFNLKKIRMCTN
jgi:hypothetical protein